ncbi:aminodeoxychorismate synthase component I [Francisella sp. Scap27]|uniref:aminodeoxychorismate synthase component I n=1 Tax=Francisella sp. Scap27 TaxID=2589986 RepID=UPI0015BD2D02|nr:aminodeoxychorismate synthase component I [Francisella sp. Scap27]QLE78416.1 aminodeoxychorismate synthase component I [Francisella sp. Scap27]
MNFSNDYAIFENKITEKDKYFFHDPVEEIIAKDKASLDSAFKELTRLQQKGLYLVGYVSYEASYYLTPYLAHLRSDNSQKLLHFIAYKNYSTKIPSDLLSKDDEGAIDLLYDHLSLHDYGKQFLEVYSALTKGDSYQINLTKRVAGQTDSKGLELYNILKRHQQVRYASYLQFKDDEIISLSPELFFEKTQSKLTVKPMKGTAEIIEDDNDGLIYNKLKNCTKNKAENLIIVDLLRNDLSTIAKNHLVKVDKIFEIEKYKTLYQMVSQISAEVTKEISIKKIFKNLFPCGSITGAPKKRTMEYIKNIESGNRGIYTGAIGYIMPNNDMTFSVAIRTIKKNGRKIKFGVGGGITVSSEINDEWQEMNTKMSFIKEIYKPKFSIIESIYFSNQFKDLDLHLERLKLTAQKLFFEVDIAKLKQSLISYTRELDSNKQYKIRLEYLYDKKILITDSQIDNTNKKLVKLTVCPEKIDSNNFMFRYKTTHISTRGFYTDMHNKYIGKEDNKELVFVNEQDNITETRFHNILVKKDNKIYTPRLEDGILDGIARKKLLSDNKISQRSISLKDLENADEIYLVNSVRGIIEARLEQ